MLQETLLKTDVSLSCWNIVPNTVGVHGTQLMDILVPCHVSSQIGMTTPNPPCLTAAYQSLEK